MRRNICVAIALSAVMICFSAAVVPAQQPLKVGDVTANPGEKKSGFIYVPGGEDGPEVNIPVTVINGTREGPVLALIAGTHGYEYPPVIALQRLRKELEPAQLSGTVIMIHVLNMPSFMKRTIYYNPNDWKNQNRVFPGKENGSQSERIAFQITKHVIDQCDYLIDHHCGDGNEDLTPYLYCTEIGNPEVDRRTRELAINFGFKVIVFETERPKDQAESVYVGNTALLKGKPAITTESGKLGMTDEEDIDRLVKGTYNTLKHLNMIEGRPELMFEPVWVTELTIITSEHDGLFYPLVTRGQHVQKDELVGYLTDFFGEVIQEVKAPYDGMIMYIIATPPMNRGEPMVSVGAFDSR
ncbi:succinylglutamate desuccinylase/aspartoacylase family protein [candidate division KSB1 bacterium]